VVVTAGAIGHAKLQSNHYHQQPNIKSELVLKYFLVLVHLGLEPL